MRLEMPLLRSLLRTPLLTPIRHFHNPLLLRGKGRPPGPSVKEKINQRRKTIESIQQRLKGQTLLTEPLVVDTPKLRVPIYNLLKGQTSESIDLDPHIFLAPLRNDILHSVIRWQRARARQNSIHSKNRAEVSGTGKKPHPQKGTGRARQGTKRAPHHKGGGVAFAPKHRDMSYPLPKKIRSFGLRIALSSKLLEGKLKILDTAILESTSKALVVESLEKNYNQIEPRMKVKSYLLIHSNSQIDISNNTILATRSLQYVDYLPVIGANVLDIMKHPLIFITRDALRDLYKRIYKIDYFRNRKLRYAVGEKGEGVSPQEFEQLLIEGKIKLPSLDDFPVVHQGEKGNDSPKQINSEI